VFRENVCPFCASYPAGKPSEVMHRLWFGIIHIDLVMTSEQKMLCNFMSLAEKQKKKYMEISVHVINYISSKFII